MRRIRGQQHVQERRAAARQAHNEKRLANLMLRDLWIGLAIAMHEQAIREISEHVGFQRHPADDIQSRLAMTCLQQARKRFEEFPTAKILKPGPPFRDVNQARGFERVRVDPKLAQDAPRLIQDANRNRRASLGESAGRFHVAQEHVVW